MEEIVQYFDNTIRVGCTILPSYRFSPTTQQWLRCLENRNATTLPDQATIDANQQNHQWRENRTVVVVCLWRAQPWICATFYTFYTLGVKEMGNGFVAAPGLEEISGEMVEIEIY